MKSTTRFKIDQTLLELLPKFDPKWPDEQRKEWFGLHTQMTKNLIDDLDDVERETWEEKERERLEPLIIEELRRAGLFEEIANLVRGRIEAEFDAHHSENQAKSLTVRPYQKKA